MAATLAQKLLLKPGMRAAVINAPPDYRAALPDAELVDVLQPDLDFVQLFVANRSELDPLLADAAAALRPDGLLWISYRKGGEKAGTDLNRDLLWQAAQAHDLVGVTLVAVDETWSAMRFRRNLGNS